MDTASSDPLDEAALQVAVQAAFLQGFAEKLTEDERPIEEVLPSRPGSAAIGWREQLQW